MTWRTTSRGRSWRRSWQRRDADKAHEVGKAHRHKGFCRSALRCDHRHGHGATVVPRCLCEGFTGERWYCAAHLALHDDDAHRRAAPRARRQALTHHGHDAPGRFPGRMPCGLRVLPTLGSCRASLRAGGVCTRAARSGWPCCDGRHFVTWCDAPGFVTACVPVGLATPMPLGPAAPVYSPAFHPIPLHLAGRNRGASGLSNLSLFCPT